MCLALEAVQATCVLSVLGTVPQGACTDVLA